MALRFSQALNDCLRAIPRGRVGTCGQIAKALGDVRSARTVAAWLLSHPTTYGAHRVVRADGQPVLANAASRLSKEGIRLTLGRVPETRFVSAVPHVRFLTELRQEQRRLSEEVSEQDEIEQVRIVAGVDVAYDGDRAHVAVVSCDHDTLDAVEIVQTRTKVDFPYIPTYLAYREFPAIERAVKRMAHRPDVLLIDGHGRLHPALFGIACFAGVRLRMPTIGVAKNPLVGKPRPPQRTSTGAMPIELEGRVRGYAWTPPHASRPLYVSVGHRISLETALSVAQHTTRSRIPEPLRLADLIAKRMKRGEKV